MSLNRMPFERPARVLNFIQAHSDLKIYETSRIDICRQDIGSSMWLLGIY